MKEQDKKELNKKAGEYKADMTPKEFNIWVDDFLTLGMGDKNKSLADKYIKKEI